MTQSQNQLNVLVLMLSTIVPENDKFTEKINKRKKQYITGLQKLFEFNFKSNDIDVILIDNSTAHIHTDILNSVPSYVKIINFEGNKYGKINKGCGLIEGWEYISPIIKDYKYVLHFEPRQLLTSHEFFIDFLNNKQNMFMVRNNNHFYTGLFSLESQTIINFINTYNQKYLVDNHCGIEYLLFNYISSNQIKFLKCETLNAIRFDPYTKSTIIL